MISKLLPERHPEPDLFIAEIFDLTPFKDDRHTMEHPFFSLSTRKYTEPIKYDNGNGIKISISPNTNFGQPTIFDKDILLYLGSQLIRELNAGRVPPKTIQFTSYDLLVATNRETSGRGYALLEQAFDCLTTCYIKTNIKTIGFEITKGFHIIEGYEIIKSTKDKSRTIAAKVTLSDWFYNSLLAKEILTIDRDYFRLRSPLARRLYEIGRKHCGNQKDFTIKLETLYEKSGVKSPLKNFRYQIRQLIKDDLEESFFPEYRFFLSNDDVVKFSPKNPQQDIELKDIPRISTKAKETAHDLCIKARTGWDYYNLESDFIESLEKGFKPDNVNGAFINFVKTKVATRP